MCFDPEPSRNPDVYFLCGAFGVAPILQKDTTMLAWAITFLVIALVAGVFGFTGIATASAGIAQILFVVFFVLFLVAMVVRAIQGKPPV
jgi:uncharacterized membrane protein YtjA (UPF0391 family)